MMEVIITLGIQFIAAALGTLAFTIMFIVPRKHYLTCAIIGGVCWIVYYVSVHYFGISKVVSTAMAAIVVVFLSRIYGVRRKCPATLFLLSGIFPLVPGVGIYWMVYSGITGDMEACVSYARSILGTAAAIVLGIAFVHEIPQSLIVKIAKIGGKTVLK